MKNEGAFGWIEFAAHFILKPRRPSRPMQAGSPSDVGYVALTPCLGWLPLDRRLIAREGVTAREHCKGGVRFEGDLGDW
jgi:hypothetical protein